MTTTTTAPEKTPLQPYLGQINATVERIQLEEVDLEACLLELSAEIQSGAMSASPSLVEAIGDEESRDWAKLAVGQALCMGGVLLHIDEAGLEQLAQLVRQPWFVGYGAPEEPVPCDEPREEAHLSAQLRALVLRRVRRDALMTATSVSLEFARRLKATTDLLEAGPDRLPASK